MRIVARSMWMLVVAVAMAACTAIYHREFVAETIQPSTRSDREQILERYRQFMESNGYTSSSVENAGGRWLSFTIRDARSKLMPTSRISDRLTVGLDSAGDLRVEIMRISSYPPDDFSDAYLAEFTNITEKYMRETSGKDVKLRLVKK